ncbi:OprO/OprP family phosphate-selective porin [Nitrosomonas sp. Nm33]|uniref:OprO/OprP family phosphate-selective porin n=1 Tax=Nitrosomonas sp. Nm33 TaxID=133724 RepID=UPI00089A642B|nr:porin [Nitrosomonas sp. Nm33]SDY25092.1 phosphate-selective porin OprO and OprP [Nitrosomonas sp. Nm33]
MKIFKHALAFSFALSAGVISDAIALELYVDTETKQIFAEPGPGRVLLGTFVKAEDIPPKTETPKVLSAPSQTSAEPSRKTESAELAPARKDQTTEVADKATTERLSNQISVLEERVKEAEKVHMDFDDRGLHFKTKDGNFSFAVNGRIQPAAEYNFINEPNPPIGSNTPNELNSGATIRRARLGVEGTFFKVWDYKLEYDFSRGNGTVAAGITDAFVRFNHTDALSYKIGSFKEPFSLEEAASNRFLTFIERHMAVNAFIDNPNVYKTGIGVNYAVPRWQTGIAFQTEPIGAGNSANTSVNANGNQNRNNGSGDTGWTAIGRITGRPWMEDDTKFLHVGISAGHTTVNTQFRADGTMVGEGSTSGGGMSFVGFLGTNVDRTSVLNTGNLSNGALTDPNRRQITSFDRYGAESWLVYGPFSAQAEFLRTNINGVGYDNEHLTGYYGFVSYFLTGESKAYHVRNGAANRIKPKKPFHWNLSGLGAWEVAAGYDFIDMNSGVIRGGRASMFRFALNWYPHSNVKFQNNMVYLLDIDTSGTPTTNTRGYSGGAGARTHGWDNGGFAAFLSQITVDF